MRMLYIPRLIHAYYCSTLVHLFVLSYVTAQLQTGMIYESVTGVLGGDISLSCYVDRASFHETGWKLVDRDITLAIGDKVNIDTGDQRRYSVSYVDGHPGTLSLNIHNITGWDKGHYMCRNTKILKVYQLTVEDGPEWDTAPPSPAINYTACCYEQHVSATCMPLCHPTPASYANYYNDLSLCMGDVKKIMACGNGERNHGACCIRSGVPKDCLDMCTTVPENLNTHLSMCSANLREIIECYRKGQTSLPSPPQNVKVTLQADGILVRWTNPMYNVATVQGFHVFFKNINAQVPHTASRLLSATTFEYSIAVHPNVIYDVYVVAFSNMGASYPSIQTQIYTASASERLDWTIDGCCRSYHVSSKCAKLLCHPSGLRSLKYSVIKKCYEELPSVFKCIAGLGNHTACCQFNGIPSNCDPLCGGEMNIPVDFAMAPCFRRLPLIESCIASGSLRVPPAPFSVSVGDVTASTAIIHWQPVGSPAPMPSQYIVIAHVKNIPLEQRIEEVTINKQVMLQGLLSSTFYQVQVYARNVNGTSLASPTVIFQTQDGVYLPPNPPNQAMERSHNAQLCCKLSGVPLQCSIFCDSLSDMSHNNPQQLASCQAHIGKMLKCTTDGRDHSQCCVHNSVQKYCLPYCAYEPGHYAVNSTMYAVCTADPNVKFCQSYGYASLPRSPDSLRSTKSSTHTITVTWRHPTRGSPPAHYLVEYRIKEPMPTPPMQMTVTADQLTATIQNLRPGTRYEITILSQNVNGTSMSSDLLYARTKEEFVQKTPLPPLPAQPEINPATHQPVEPAANRSECCMRSVHADCRTTCSHSVIPSNGSCLTDMYAIVGCATDGRDHSSCCDPSKVVWQCRGLCRGEIIPNTIYHSVCATYVDWLLTCFQDAIGSVPSHPRSLAIKDITWDSATLEWQPPLHNPVGVTYRIKEQHIQAGMAPIEIRRKTTKTRYTLRNLKSFNMYGISIIAFNKFGKSQPSAYHIIRTLHSASADLRIDRSPKGIIASNTSSQVKLYCSRATSLMRDTYEWYHGTNSKQAIAQKKELVIRDVQKVNAGWYMCKVGTDHIMHYLPVKYKPEIYNLEGENRTLSSISATLRCHINGHPDRVIWKKDNIKLVPDVAAKQNLITKDGLSMATLTIVISTVVYGEYSCQAVNQYGSDEAFLLLADPTAEPTVNLTEVPVASAVPDVPSCCRRKSVVQSCQVACEFDVNLMPLLAKRRTLKCLEPAILQPILECAADGRDHTDCCQRANVNPRCLSFCRGVVPQDYNKISESCTASAPAIVACMEHGHMNIPSPPQRLLADFVNNVLILLSWSPPSKNRELVTMYAVQYEENGVTQPPIKLDKQHFTFSISNVKSKAQYKIWVTAGNHHGSSVKAFTRVITIPDLAPKKPINVNSILEEGNMIKLSWNMPVSFPNWTDFVVYYSNAPPQYEKVETTEMFIIIGPVKMNVNYIMYVVARNSFGMSEKSKIIQYTVKGTVAPQPLADIPSTTGIAVGIAFGCVVIIVAVIVGVYCARKRAIFKAEEPVSFENPAYYDTGQPVKIGIAGGVGYVGNDAYMVSNQGYMVPQLVATATLTSNPAQNNNTLLNDGRMQTIMLDKRLQMTPFTFAHLHEDKGSSQRSGSSSSGSAPTVMSYVSDDQGDHEYATLDVTDITPEIEVRHTPRTPRRQPRHTFYQSSDA